MSSADANATHSQPSSWPLYRALVGVGIVCGLLIVSVYVLTLPVIARNEAEALQHGLVDRVRLERDLAGEPRAERPGAHQRPAGGVRRGPLPLDPREPGQPLAAEQSHVN